MKLLLFVLCAFVFSTIVSADTCIATAECKPNPPIYDLPLDDNGKYVLSISDIDNGSSTNCPPLTLRIANAPVNNTLTCNTSNKVPPYNLTLALVASAPGAQNSVCLTQYRVVDNIPPTAICKNITVGSDATITGLSVDGGSFDNCDIRFRIVNQTTFGGCNDVVVVSLTVFDYSGNSDSCFSTVSITDTNPPVAICQDSIQDVGATDNGSITITKSQGSIVNDGSVDECDGTNLNLEFTFNNSITRNCSTLATIPVTLEVTDTSGNDATCNANLIFQDNTNPTAVCAPVITANVGDGSYTISAEEFTGASYDVCGIASYGNNVQFTCDDLGPNFSPANYTIISEIRDFSNNPASCSTNVTIRDASPPEALCIEPSYSFNVGSGLYTLTPLEINSGSFDVCSSVLNYTLTKTSYNCSDVGTSKSANLTVTDDAKNSASCTTPLVIVDSTPPAAKCQAPFTVNVGLTGSYTVLQSNGSFIDNGSSDVCTAVNVTLAQETQVIDCLSLGQRTYTLVATDAYGNFNRCSTVVTFADQTPPTVACASAANVDIGDGFVHVITSATLMTGTSDVCGVTYSAPHAFSCNTTGLGNISVNSTAYDPSKNNGTCTTIVDVYDGVVPNARCQRNPKLNVGTTGNVTITVANIDNGSFDDCTSVVVAIAPGSQTNYLCSDVGNTVEVGLVVTDTSSNFDVCSSPLQIVDTTAPVAVCKAYTVDVGAAPGGSVVLTATQGIVVNNNSVDICTPQPYLTYTLNSEISGSCNSLGTRPTTLTVTDLSGNSAKCNSTITFADLTPPTAVCVSSSSLNVGAGPNSPLLNSIATSYDTCGVVTYNTSTPTYTCANLGSINFTVVVTDASNNTNSCTTTLNIVDLTSPNASCVSSLTLQVGTGSGSLTTANITTNATVDLCDPSPALSISPSTFACADLGNRHVTMTVTDASGNIDTCVTPVSVVDTTPPVATCQNVNIEVGNTGYVVIPTTSAYLINNGSFDICYGPNDLNTILDQTYSANCSTLGIRAATLIVTDGSNNTNTCTGNINFVDTIVPTLTCALSQTVDVGSNNVTFNPYLSALIAYDTCGLNITSNITTLTCADIGVTQTALIIATDPSGNTVNCTSPVIGVDLTGPTAVCQVVNVNVGNGTYTLNTTLLDAGSADACNGTLTFYANQTQFTCAEVGKNISVEMIVLDQYGNPSAPCYTKVIVNDTTIPVAVCRNVSISIGETGTETFRDAFFDGGSYDICSPVTLKAAQTTFTCADVGATTTVLLTVTDANGNINTCTSHIVVSDFIAPVAKCKSILLTANGAVTTAMADNGSYDNCPPPALAISPPSFSNSIGGSALLTVTDTAGNINTCVSQVTIDVSQNLTVSPTTISEHIPFTISWAADVKVSNKQIVTLILVNSENSFYYLISDNVLFGRLSYVVAGGVSGVTADRYYLIEMYINGSFYAAKAIYIQHYPTSD